MEDKRRAGGYKKDDDKLLCQVYMQAQDPIKDSEKFVPTVWVIRILKEEPAINQSKRMLSKDPKEWLEIRLCLEHY
ncbi:hypothetical protein Ccrd_026287 [Cynara cardunculus var. scolymus]|uniref:Uncharacterized protein n=1 Tax=Cynara cardunculus var. scolymus TaxID=59895 RepID=A0A103R8N2_CYNCS|nr:hypothetical protein Ccrd_026287 [Cynara cardunculus var. scolymus]